MSTAPSARPFVGFSINYYPLASLATTIPPLIRLDQTTPLAPVVPRPYAEAPTYVAAIITPATADDRFL